MKVKKKRLLRVKLYRFIVFLNILKKILKKKITKRLSDYIEENALLLSK